MLITDTKCKYIYLIESFFVMELSTQNSKFKNLISPIFQYRDTHIYLPLKSIMWPSGNNHSPSLCTPSVRKQVLSYWSFPPWEAKWIYGNTDSMDLKKSQEKSALRQKKKFSFYSSEAILQFLQISQLKTIFLARPIRTCLLQ